MYTTSGRQTISLVFSTFDGYMDKWPRFIYFKAVYTSLPKVSITVASIKLDSSRKLGYKITCVGFCVDIFHRAVSVAMVTWWVCGAPSFIGNHCGCAFSYYTQKDYFATLIIKKTSHLKVKETRKPIYSFMQSCILNLHNFVRTQNSYFSINFKCKVYDII